MTTSRKPLKIDLTAFRKDLGLNQHAFWSALGVTQSGGSRYESGRKIPKPIATLLELLYIRKIDLKRIDNGDIKILSYLKERQPDLYATLLKATGVKSASNSIHQTALGVTGG